MTKMYNCQISRNSHSQLAAEPRQYRRTAAINSKEDEGRACESNGIEASLEIVAGCEMEGAKQTNF